MDNFESINKKLEKHDEDISEIKQELAVNSTLTEKCTATMEKLSDTMTTMQITMVTMNESTKTSNRNSEEMKQSIKELNVKVDMIEDKSKIDWQVWIKGNIGKILLFLIMTILAFPTIGEIFIKIFG